MAATASTTTPSPALLPTRRARTLGLAAALTAVVACAAASLAIGSLSIPLGEVVGALLHPGDADTDVVVTELRLPRTELGLLVGAALGTAGALLQGITRNPMAEPGILGINAGAAFAVVVAIRLLGIGSPAVYAAFALVGAGLSAVAVHLLGSAGRGGATPVRLTLAGAVLTALLMSLTSAVLVLDVQTLDAFRFWTVGSLAGRDAAATHVLAVPILAALAAAFVAGRSLNALALGDEVARSLGQRVTAARATAGAAAVVLAGCAVAAAGPITFVGLAVPHIARALVGPDERWALPYSAVLGAVLLVCADVLGRVVARPAELQVGIVTALLGAPFFVWLVRRRRLAAL